jgi:hypothetical protein
MLACTQQFDVMTGVENQSDDRKAIFLLVAKVQNKERAASNFAPAACPDPRN